MNRNALVCGGSRGLGRALAHALAEAGYGVAICARSAQEVDHVRGELEQFGARVYAESCDLSDERAARRFVGNAERELGPIDVLVANAATMLVAPVETLHATDFDDAMRSIFDAALNPALAALPLMRARRRGTIAFITSIGGVIGVPHLAPYSAAKFATVGLAEALGAEVKKDGVRVLTVIPGLMRTGSHVRAEFRGSPAREYAWFAASAIAPLVSIDPDRAARRIVRAIERRKTRLVYTLPARLAARLHALAPTFFSTLMKLAASLLPRAPALPSQAEGREIQGKTAKLLDRRSRDLALRHAQW